MIWRIAGKWAGTVKTYTTFAFSEDEARRRFSAWTVLGIEFDWATLACRKDGGG